MTMTGWNGSIGGANWWARALAFAACCGLALGLIGPFGSFLNGAMTTLVPHWIGMTIVGTLICGFCIPPLIGLGVRLGLPRLFSFALALALTALPISVISAVVTSHIWPSQVARLGPADWYGQTLLLQVTLIGLWTLLDRALSSIEHPGPAPVRAPPQPTSGRPANPNDPILCLQMEDHYVRVHRATGSVLELIPMYEAIARVAEHGMLVHRSWWVARAAIVGVERSARSTRLLLTSGLSVPVARNRLADVRAAGWLDGE